MPFDLGFLLTVRGEQAGRHAPCMQVSHVGEMPALQWEIPGEDRGEQREHPEVILAVLQQGSWTESCEGWGKYRFKKHQSQGGASLWCQESWFPLRGWVLGTVGRKLYWLLMTECAGHFALVTLKLLTALRSWHCHSHFTDKKNGGSERLSKLSETRLMVTLAVAMGYEPWTQVPKNMNSPLTQFFSHFCFEILLRTERIWTLAVVAVEGEDGICSFWC